MKGTPINCLAGSSPPPFPTGDLPFITLDPEKPPEGIVLRDGVWPQVLVAEEKDAALAGATGGPWVDANAHVVRLAQTREPGKQVWLTYTPPGAKDIVPVEDYVRPIAEAGAYGARWVITLDEQFVQGIDKGERRALGAWQQMMSVLKLFESRREWREWQPVAALTVVSSFDGDAQLLAEEFLNLAPRRHLAHRIVLTSDVTATSFEKQKAIIYLEAAPPEGEARSRLLQFAENGGIVFVPPRDRQHEADRDKAGACDPPARPRTRDHAIGQVGGSLRAGAPGSPAAQHPRGRGAGLERRGHEQPLSVQPGWQSRRSST